MIEKLGRVLNYNRISGFTVLSRGLIILISRNARAVGRQFRQSRHQGW
jgi:hypothetical protein